MKYKVKKEIDSVDELFNKFLKKSVYTEEILFSSFSLFISLIYSKYKVKFLFSFLDNKKKVKSLFLISGIDLLIILDFLNHSYQKEEDEIILQKIKIRSKKEEDLFYLTLENTNFIQVLPLDKYYFKYLFTTLRNLLYNKEIIISQNILNSPRGK